MLLYPEHITENRIETICLVSKNRTVGTQRVKAKCEHLVAAVGNSDVFRLHPQFRRERSAQRSRQRVRIKVERTHGLRHRPRHCGRRRKRALVRVQLHAASRLGRSEPGCVRHELLQPLGNITAHSLTLILSA